MDLQLKGNWNQITGLLKEKYANLTDDDFKEAEGKVEQLIGTLQKKTDKRKEELLEEIEEMDSKSI